VSEEQAAGLTISTCRLSIVLYRTTVDRQQ